MSDTLLGRKLEALEHQLQAATPLPWRMDDDPRHASLFAALKQGQLEYPQLVATGMLPQDARLIELVLEVLPDLITRVRCRGPLDSTEHPCVRVDLDGAYWVWGWFYGILRRKKCSSFEDALEQVRLFQERGRD